MRGNTYSSNMYSAIIHPTLRTRECVGVAIFDRSWGVRIFPRVELRLIQFCILQCGRVTPKDFDKYSDTTEILQKVYIIAFRLMQFETLALVVLALVLECGGAGTEAKVNSPAQCEQGCLRFIA